jgi:uncharacterized Zn-binding protein involved in type VI secretion
MTSRRPARIGDLACAVKFGEPSHGRKHGHRVSFETHTLWRALVLISGGPIRLSDKTTGGGTVISVSATSFRLDDLPIALVGDSASCSIHGGVHAFVEGCVSRTCNGRGWVLQGHRLSCGCTAISSCADRMWVQDSARVSTPIPAKPASPAGFPKTVHTATAAVSYATAAWGTNPVDSRRAGNFFQWFLLRDSTTGEPLINHPYTALVNGTEQPGTTDGSGYANVAADHVTAIAIHAACKAPMRVLAKEQKI